MEVYCHQCRKKRSDDAIYCSQCGRLLAAEEEAAESADAERAEDLSETAASTETELENGQLNLHNAARKRSPGSAVWAWLIPVVLAIFTAAFVFSYYIYQSRINDRVIKLQAEAKSSALAGKYAEALAMLKEAANARPDFAAVQKDTEIAAHAAELERIVKTAGKQLDELKLDEAEQTIGRVKDSLKGHAEPIYAKVKDQLGVYSVKLGVMKLKEELADLGTVDELEAKLNVANHLDGEEAAAVREQIIAKIVDISSREAEALLQKKKYTDALTVTDRALTFANDNEHLISLEKRINQAQAKYEETEQQRLEQAMQKAAAEDLKNQTAAVEVVNIVTTLDEFGDLNIEAELKNVATRPIYSITIQFIVNDAEGNEVGAGTAEATPDYVEPGEKMSFISTVYGVGVENTTVVVDHATWYLD